jgi:hypothetical protein
MPARCMIMVKKVRPYKIQKLISLARIMISSSPEALIRLVPRHLLNPKTHLAGGLSSPTGEESLESDVYQN